MKRLLLLLTLSLGIVSCGGAWEVSSNVYRSGPCSTATYQYGAWGWGFYDCFGSPAGPGWYSNYGYNYGPRIIFTKGKSSRSKTRVRSSSPRGSSVVRGTRNQTGSSVQQGTGSSGNNTPNNGGGRRGNKNKY